MSTYFRRQLLEQLSSLHQGNTTVGSFLVMMVLIVIERLGFLHGMIRVYSEKCNLCKLYNIDNRNTLIQFEGISDHPLISLIKNEISSAVIITDK